MKDQNKEPNQKPDLFRRAKHVGYCWSNLPPDKETGFSDFLEYARFQLCMRTHRLMKDPIWDRYSDIEVLAEYFAWLYTESKEHRQRLETEIGASEDIYAWLDRMVEGNQKDLEAKAEELEATVEFDPSEIIGG